MKRKRILAGLAALTIIPISLIAADHSPASAASGMYANVYATVTGTVSGLTSGTVQVLNNQQGTRDPSGNYSDTGYGPNYSFAGITLTGTCINGGCTSPPQVWIGMMMSHYYCSANGVPCFIAGDVVNGVMNWGSSSNYTEATGGEPNDGSYHSKLPGGGSSAHGPSVGYQIVSGKVEVLWGGNVVGWFSDSSTWGQDFGTVTGEALQSQVFNPSTTWTGGPIPSMSWAFNGFTDSNGNQGHLNCSYGGGTNNANCPLLSTWSVDSPYTETAGFDVNLNEYFTLGGGNDPSMTSYYPQMEASSDNGYCLDNYNGNNTNGNKIQLWSCSGNANQEWRYDSNTSRLVNSTGKCLDDPNDSTTNGTKMQLYTCNTLNSQKWTITYFLDSGSNPSSGYFEFVNENGKCLDNTNNTQTDGTQIQIWTCNSDTAQHWDGELYDFVGA